MAVELESDPQYPPIPTQYPLESDPQYRTSIPLLHYQGGWSAKSIAHNFIQPINRLRKLLGGGPPKLAAQTLSRQYANLTNL